jgi:ATP-binding cassette, subfamily C, bacterial LapB
MIAGLVTASLLINLLNLALPITLLQIYDRIIPHRATSTLTLLIIGVSIALLIELFLRIARAYLNAWSDAKLEYGLCTHAFHHLLNAQSPAYEKEGVGSHVEHITALTHFKSFYGEQALITLMDIPFIMIFLGLIYYLGGIIVLIPTLALIAAFAIAILTGKNLYELTHQQRTLDDQRMNFILETLTGLHTVKALAMESQMIRRYERLQKNSTQWYFKLTELTANTLACSTLLSQITLVMVVGLGSLLVINQHLTIGALAACMLLSNLSLQPVNRLMLLWKHLHGIDVAKACLQHIEQLPLDATTLSTTSVRKDHDTSSN